MPKKKDIDAVDVEILNLLSKDGGLTYQDLSEAIGKTPGPTHTRVKKLLNKDLLQKISLVNWEKFGYNCMTLTILSVPKHQLSQVINELYDLKGVLMLTEIKRETPSQNISYIALVMVTKTKEEYTNTLGDAIGSLDIAIDFNIFEVGQLIKFTPNIELDLADVQEELI